MIWNFIALLRAFYRHARWRLPLLYAVIALGGFIEMIGIVTVLPLLNIAVQEAADNPLSRAIIGSLQWIGVTPTLANLLLVLVAIFAVRGVFQYLNTFLTAYITLSVRRNVQIEFVNRFSAMPFSYFAQRSAGWFNNIIVTEVNRFVSSLRGFCRVSVNGMNALVALPFALVLNPQLTLFIFGISGAVLVVLLGLIKRTTVLSKEQTLIAGRLNSEFIQLIQAFVYLKSTGTAAFANRHVKRSVGRVAENDLRIKQIAAALTAVKEPIAVAVLAGFIYYEVALQGGSLAQIMVAALVVYRMLVQLVAMAPDLQNFHQTIGGVILIQDAIRELDRQVEISGPHTVENLDRPIVFENVSFRHGDREVLKGIDIEIRPNEMVGIVGESGAGKTTVFHLLTGLVEPSSGNISVDGRPFSEIDKASFRAHIGYVTQEPIIFNDTVANNISLWRHDGRNGASQKVIEEAARKARCDTFIKQGGRGYDSPLGDRGISLSGGERQRIAIAREIYKNPQLLIFDEAASALDAESERYVQESIDQMHGERTVVVITHRLASVRNCDRIYVFQSGRVVESGTFDELHGRADSYFRRMCDQQAVTR